jgi:DNA-binding response OmpR family regulator
MRVLVIEDDEEVREAIATELLDAGHEVMRAADGAAALQMLAEKAERSPDVILLDLMMPHMDGQLFRLRQLEDSRFSSIPTLVMTAREIDKKTRSELGEALILRKPFEAHVLLAALQDIVEPPHASKSCRCGRRYDRDSWLALRFVGEVDNGREAGERLELRQCLCNSTLAWELGRHAMSIPLIRSSSRRSGPG